MASLNFAIAADILNVPFGVIIPAASRNSPKTREIDSHSECCPMINLPKCPPGETLPSNVSNVKISCLGFKKSRIPNAAAKITRDPIQMFIFSNHRRFVKSAVANIVAQMNTGMMPIPK